MNNWGSPPATILLLVDLVPPIALPRLIQKEGGSKDRNEVTSWVTGTKLGPDSLVHDS